MSYNVISTNVKNKNFSKLLHSYVEESEDFFIFNIYLETCKKKIKKLKKIKNTRNDFLINIFDKINFNKYTKIEICFININNPLITHTIIINLNKESIIYKDDMIYLEINKQSDYMTCFYNLDVKIT